MEMKTIRFEKGDSYEDDDVFKEIHHLFVKTKNRIHESDTYFWWTPIKSFTVQINIIEDEREDI